MVTTSFDLTISVGHDVRLVAAVGDLVRQAALHAGYARAAADSFGGRVEAAVRGSMDDRGSHAGPLPVTLRSRNGTVEVLVGGLTLTLDSDDHRASRAEC